MTIKEFIDKTIEGEWLKTKWNLEVIEYKLIQNNTFRIKTTDNDNPEAPAIENTYDLEFMFLDPKAWEAVGKVEGWIDLMPSRHEFNDDIAEWKHKMYSMIYALIGGLSIKEYIKNL